MSITAPQGVDVPSLTTQVEESLTWLNRKVVRKWGDTLDEGQLRLFLLLVRHIESEGANVSHKNGCFIGLNYIVRISVLAVLQ